MPERGARAGDALGPLERLLLLKRTPLVRAVSDEAAAALAEAARERFVPAGRTLLREEEPPASLYFVASGAVSMRWRGAELGRVGAWAPVAGLHAFLQGEAGLEATALRDTLTLEVGADAFADILEDHFDLAHVLLRHLAGDLLDLSQRYGCAPGAASPEAHAATLELASPPGLDLVERMLLLKGLGLFSRASLTTLAQLARGLEEIALPPRTGLWAPEESSDEFLLILEGLVQCEPATPGNGFELGPGCALGLLELLAARPDQVRARTLGPVRALRGRGEAVVDALEDDAELAFQVMAFLARATLSLVAAKGEGPQALGRLMGCSAAELRTPGTGSGAGPSGPIP